MWLLIFLAGDVSLNPGPPVLWDDFPVATAARPVFGSVNLCGLLSKIDDVRFRLGLHRLQAFAIQESHLHSRISSAELAINGYHLFRKDRAGAAKGGVALYLADSLHPSKLSSIQLLSGISELIAAKTNFRKRSIIFASIYLAPKSRCSAQQFDEWLDSLASWLAWLGNNVFDLVLLGDLNLAPDEPNFIRLWSVLNSFGLTSIVNEPTHGGGKIPRKQIDYVFVGSPLLGGKCHLGPPLEKQASGHACLLFSPISVSSAKPTSAIRSIRLFKNTDLPKAHFLLEYLQNGDHRDLSSEVAAKSSPEEAAGFLILEIWRSFSESTPFSKIYPHTSSPPFDPELSKLVRQRHAAYSAWKNGDYTSKSLVNRLRNKIRFVLRQKRKEWALETLENAPSNPSGFWKAINRISGKARQPIPTLIRGNAIAVSDDRKAELLSEVFQENFNLSVPSLLLSQSFNQPIEDLDILTSEVSAAISKMNSSAPGNDGIPPAFIKALKKVLARPIAVLLLKCIETGTFPKILKTAKVTAIPQITGSTAPADFRPISITSALSKVFEHWLLVRIRPQIQPADFQFGFRRHSGTDCAIACLQHLIAIGLDACPKIARVLVISFDIFRAFDQVNHGLLLAALQERGIQPYLQAMITSFLQNRSQFVQVGSAHSIEKPVLSGVCQCSILGPALFNVFVDKIFSHSQLSSNASLIMYADDLCYVKPLPDGESELEAQKDIDQLLKLYGTIDLRINPQKSQQLLVSASSQKLPTVHLQIDGVEIPSVVCLRYLGVAIDQHLSFGLHARQSAVKAKQQLCALYRAVGRWVPSSIFLRLVKQKVLPQVTYALPVAATSNKGDWRQIEGVLKFALRLVSNNYTLSYPHLLSQYNMVPVARLYMDHAATLVYKFVYGLRHFPFPIFSRFICPAATKAHRVTRSLTSSTVKNTKMRLYEWHFTRTGQRQLETCLRLPIYRLIRLWNLMDDVTISYGLSRFRRIVADLDSLFDAFCSSFKYRNTVIYSVFQDM